ncbi:MAG TPA: MerR family transcriptional regulator, partial [Rhodanobacteraceae bacterium]|nr:MerR family transcriptional regulator [Rhodanobacteraceae bacterium]
RSFGLLIVCPVVRQFANNNQLFTVVFEVADGTRPLGSPRKYALENNEDELMRSGAAFLSPSQAAEQLGVSTKALRLYEKNGLLRPVRTAAGWRTYGPSEMQQAAEIATLRALGFSLAQIGRVLRGDSEGLEPALAAHQAVLEQRIRTLVDAGRDSCRIAR